MEAIRPVSPQVDPNRTAPRQIAPARRRRRKAKPGDLLGDVAYLAGCAAAGKADVRCICARAAIVMGVAAMESITGDALATIRQLLAEPVPPGGAKTPPWCFFAGRSADRIVGLLRKGAFPKRRDYLLERIEKATGATLEKALINDMSALITFRNRIVHMRYRHSPDHHRAVVELKQVTQLAAVAERCSHAYADFVCSRFAEMQLPLRTTAQP